MNLLDAVVKEVLTMPYERYGCWWVDVTATCWSPVVYETNLMFHSLEDALQVKPGFEFLN